MVCKKYKTWLPLFPGFYGTWLEIDETYEEEELEHWSKELGRDITMDELKFDYPKYRNEVAINFCKRVAESLNDIGLSCYIEFESIHSPTEYNFVNDSININIEFDKNQLMTLFVDSEPEEYLKYNFTSRTGFLSFFSNKLEDWIIFDNLEKPETNIGSILEAILLGHPNSIIDGEILCQLSLEGVKLTSRIIKPVNIQL